MKIIQKTKTIYDLRLLLAELYNTQPEKIRFDGGEIYADGVKLSFQYEKADDGGWNCGFADGTKNNGKIRVFRLYFFTGDSAETPEYIFNQVEILTDNGLKQRFKQAITDEQFNDGTIQRFNLSESNAEQFNADEIAEIFAYDGYSIEQEYIQL